MIQDLAQEEIVEWKQKWGGTGWDCTTQMVCFSFPVLSFSSACHLLQDRDHLQLLVCCRTWPCTLGSWGRGCILNCTLAVRL